MRILQIYDLDPIHRIGGIEIAIYELSRHLALLGHEVTVISGADGVVGEKIREGVRFINIDRSGIVRATRSLPGLSLAPYLAQISDLQIHACHYFAEQVIKWGVNPDKIRVILNGVDTNRFDPSKIRVEKKFECPVIITARRLVKKNGVDSLLRAMPYILDHIECRLLIIGDGPERHNLMHLTKKLGMEKDVEFLGAVPHNNMADYIALADIAIIPSIVEASSIFMLEAMAMCKPVVATGAWGLAEIINGRNGVLTDAGHLGEAIVELLSDRNLMMELGNRARIYVIKNHTWENIAKRIELEYLKLLKH